MARPKAVEAPKASPLAGNVPTLNQADFDKRLADWLRQHEEAKPFAALRELEDRIRKGDAKLRAAEQRGVSPDDAAYKAALDKLAALKSERDELTRTHQIPFFAMNSVHNFLRASRGWGLPPGSSIEIRIPNVFDVKVDLSEIPF